MWNDPVVDEVRRIREALAKPFDFDIAAILECSEPTVRVHLHRAVQALKKTLR